MRHLLTVSAIALLASCSGDNKDASTPKVPEKMQMKTFELPTVDAALLKNSTQSWGGNYGGVPPWDKIDPSKLGDDLKSAMDMSRAEIALIANQADAATFENTILPMEMSGQALNRSGTIFGVYSSNLNDDVISKIESEVAPLFAQFSSEVTQNAKLFARVEAVYNAREDLASEQKRLVEDYYTDFVRDGAKLNADEKALVADIDQKLASLTTKFGQNVLHDEQSYVTYITDESDLAGLPDSLVASMANAAKQRDKEGQWAITNTRSSMDPFLTYSDNRGLRETVWNTYYNRGDNGDAWDNNVIIKDILKLRAERAKVLGYDTHAHYVLEQRMAKTPEAAIALMESVWPAAIARVKEEVADMQAVADAEGADITIAPWDYRYYAEKVRKDKYDLDFNLVKPYMQMEKLREGMMWAAGELYGFQFKQIDDAPVFHEDVRVWEVTDADGKHVGLWYFDPFAREGKRSGAWMNAYRTQHKLGDTPTTVIVSNNSNFVKPAPGEPVLISWDDAQTMFHEFGHALHGLNSDVTYPSLSGTAVARDYVEFPSQLNEHWMTTPEVLNTYMTHYETGETIPKALLNKIEAAGTFNQGFSTTEYLASALIDMKLHMAGDADIDPDAFERDTLEGLGMPKEIVMRHRTPHFGHIFAGGYSAGYYSYLWSDTLTADSAEAFKEAGSFYDKDTAKRLRDNIMSVGNTIDPAEGFRRFRGRDVDTKALMRDRGFPTE